MSLNDKAVITPAVGYLFVAPPGTARPTPAELKTLDAESYGLATQVLKVTGNPTGGTYDVTVGSAPAATVPFDADAAAVQGLLEALAAVGAGNVRVSGTSATDAAGLTITLKGAASGKTITASKTGLTGGTNPDVTVAPGQTANAWKQLGHTSRDDLPEFGQDGGKTETKGTWQNESLRQVVTEAPEDYVTINLHQFDVQNLELFYGKNGSTTTGVFQVAAGAQKPVEQALLIIIVDGDTKVAFYSPKASFKQDDSISLSVDEFAALPVKATFLKQPGVSYKYEWVSELIS